MTRFTWVLSALMFFAATISNVLASDRGRHVRPGNPSCGQRPGVQVHPLVPAPPPRVRDCRPLTPRPPAIYPPVPLPLSPPVPPAMGQPGCRPPRNRPYRGPRYVIPYYPPVIYGPPVLPPPIDSGPRQDYIWNEYTKQWEPSGEQFRVTGGIFRDPESNCLVFRDSNGRKHYWGY